MTVPAGDADSRHDVPHLYLADYLVGRGHPRLARCRLAVRPGGALPYLGHYSDQNCNFALDLFDDLEAAGRLPMPAELLRRAVRDIGDELTYRLAEFDTRLAAAQSGALIRTVYQTRDGAVYCNSVVPGEYVVAVSLGTPPEPGVPLSKWAVARNADQAVAELATRLRSDLSRSNQNPGGWVLRRRSGQSATSEADVTSMVHTEEGIGPVATACRAALTITDLHFVGWVKNRDLVFAADLLEAPALSRFFPNVAVTPAIRREFYCRLARRLSVLFPELTAMIEPVAGDPLYRLVLDVEEGAVYCYRLAPGQFLIGVTLDQDRVSQADDILAELTFSVQE
jgi:hypothetical protein